VEAQRVPVTEIDDVVFINAARIADRKPVFDETTHTWTLESQQGEPLRARVLIATDGVPAGRDPEALEPYLGVAIHGLPNYFLITGPDVAAQKSYIARCLQVMADTGSTRIEVRHSTQRHFNEKRPRRIQWRRVGKHIRRAFDLGSPVTLENDLYDGSATVHIGDDGRDAHVRLTGHFDPIDGQYHWQGTILEPFDTDKLPKPAIVTIGNRSATGRITERTPQGGYSVVGVGTPPFALEDLAVR
jgi:hypothetical protein